MRRISNNKPGQEWEDGPSSLWLLLITDVKNNQNKHFAQPWVSSGLDRSVQEVIVVPDHGKHQLPFGLWQKRCFWVLPVCPEGCWTLFSHKFHVLGGGLACYCQNLIIWLNHLLEFNLVLPAVAKEGILWIPGHLDGVWALRNELGWGWFSQKGTGMEFDLLERS